MSVAKYSLYVPVTDNNGQPIPGVLLHVQKQLESLFGGFSVYDITGYWQGGYEHVRVFYVFAGSEAVLKDFLDLAAYVKTAANQESVLVTCEAAETYFV